MKRRMTRWQLAGLTAAGIIPALIFLFGLYAVTFGRAMLTLSYAITFMLIPALCLLLLWLTIRSRQHLMIKWIFTFLILVFSYCLFLMFATYGHFSVYESLDSSGNIEPYERYATESHRQIPQAGELGQPAELEYHYFYNRWAMFFQSECFTLIGTYSPEDYAAQTEALDTRYTFHTDPLDAGDTDLPPLYTLEGYEFRFLEMDSDTYRLSYPKYMILVGTNDETHEIVWSYYADDDLDYIPDPEEFLLEDCGWKFIR